MIGLQVLFVSTDFCRHLLAAATPSADASTMTIVVSLGIAVAVIAAVCAALAFYSRWSHKQKHDSHWGLFCELCKAHELDRKHRGLLKQVAKLFRMTQPAQLFSQPKWLSSSQLAAKMPSCKDELKALRDVLFGKRPGKAAAAR